MTGLEKFYLICAVVGGLIFMMRTGLQMIGSDHHGADHDVGGDADASFNLFSIHGLTGFFVIFGLVGLAMLKQSGASEGWSVVAAFFAGNAMLFAVAALSSFMLSLQSSGNLDLQNAVGSEGSVYLSIPEAGTGKAQVTFQNRQSILEAVSEDKSAIKTGERVRVVGIVNGNVLVVKKV